MNTSRARQLRSNSTDAERLLWSRLHDRGLERAKFRRQVPFAPYIVDFCCFEAKLIVELDGGQHTAELEKDQVRTARLERDGFKVLRYWNHDVLSNLEGVLETIAAELQDRTRSTSPSPLVGEGRGEGRAKSDLDGQISTPLESHLHHIRVYFEDTDAGGMVYYANYLKFAERARTEMMREAGVAHAEMIARDGLMLVVRRCTADYLKSARLDDELAIETRVVEIGGASVELDQCIRRGTELLVTIKVLIACINTAGRAARLPDYMRNAMRRDHRSTLK
jgi:acyl-CoA thioester hydrolase